MNKEDDRTNVLNNRIFSRLNLQGTQDFRFSSRPVSTKYDLMSIYDKRVKSNVAIKKKILDKESCKVSFSDYVNNIDNECILRNQFFALQNNEQSVYVPSSNSDLYEVKIKETDIKQPYNDLFKEPILDSFNPNPNTEKVGYNLFNNYTRQQVKNI
tara:strand:- start:650 stop:1117 length:468 start_codon:yes stop_codon:yes gene_type:complete